jgi:outer membrane protein OmpA-like peptidoglycan-associated protein
MKWTLAALLAAAVFGTQPQSADACGIKLVIKTSTPHKAIARSSNPSHLLLVGSPPHRLERELSAAGHDVEVEPDLAAAKRPNYSVVVTDPDHANEARTKFNGATVIVRSGDVSSDIASVETTVARRPVDTATSKPVIATSEDKRKLPIRVGGGTETHKVVAFKEASAPTPVTAEQPRPEPTKPAPEPTKPAITETAQPPVKETPAPRPVKETPTVVASFRGDEVYFSLGSSTVGGKNGTLDRDAKNLTGNTGVNVVVEGYADPTGSHEANMALGQSRAEAVRDYLVTAGVDTGRIEVISYGDTRLKYGKTDGRNRRVAIQPKK